MLETIRNDITKQNGQCSVRTLVCVPMELIDDTFNSEALESAEDYRLTNKTVVYH